ncbi:phospholipase A2 [Streptomyces sp. NPDC017979]|uniref:phospholipase A2 n=1 Tax=Streptomyces sp. NPDC017979 TaxID=3365024 RepID=UPI0037A52B92
MERLSRWGSARAAGGTLTARRGRQAAALAVVSALCVGGLAWAGANGGLPSAGGAGQRPDTVSHANATGSTDRVGALVAAGPAVYALAADGSGIYEAAERGVWKKVGDGARALYGGGAGLFRTTKGDGSVERYVPGADGSPGTWAYVGGPGLGFAVGRDRLYAVGLEASVNEWSAEGGWRRIGEGAKEVHAGGAGLFKTATDGKIHEYDQGTWREIGTAGAEVVVTDHRLYRLAPDRSDLHEWTPGRDWRRIGGPFEHVYGGEGRLLAVEKGTGDVLSYGFKVSSNRRQDPYYWRKIGGPGATFVSSSTRTYGVSPDGSAVFKYLSPLRWEKTAGTATSASVNREQKLAKLRSFVQLGNQASYDLGKAADDRSQGIPDIYAFNWTNDGCNSPAVDAPAGFDFKGACNRHDFGYRNYREILGEEGFRKGVIGVTGVGADSPKAQADQVFLQDMKKECNRPFGSGVHVQARPPLMIAMCEKAAWRYYSAVATMG